MSKPYMKSPGPSKAPLKGLFKDGIWYCSCNPRFPASHFETKNGGPNHGKWFYTCQQPQHKCCKFFLWEAEAKPREESTVLANSRDEPVTPSRSGAAARARARDGFEDATAEPETPRSWKKREIAPTNTTEATFQAWRKELYEGDGENDAPRTGDKDKDVSFITPVKKTVSSVSPGKRARETSPLTERTPSTITPMTERTKDLEDPFTGPRSKSAKFGSKDSPARFGEDMMDLSPARIGTPAMTPSAMRMLSISSPAPPDMSLQTDLTALLSKHSVSVSKEAQEELNALLRRYNGQLQGVSKGRDFARGALKKKQLELDKVRAKISELESALDMHRVSSELLMKKLKELEG